jgi:ribonuclease BN (tRNA processing enzyme)
VTTELVLLGTAGAPLPVAGRAGVSAALVVGERVLVVDCGRGAPSGFADAGLDFAGITAVYLTHLHADHVGDLAGMLLYGWGARTAPSGPPGVVAPVEVHGPARPARLPGGAGFGRITTIAADRPVPGTSDLVGHILAGYAYHLNVMPLDAPMPDPGELVRATDITPPSDGTAVVVTSDAEVTVRAVAVRHGHAVPALAYRFDTPDGSVVFSGDTTVSENLIRLAAGADVLVHQVADLAYLRRHGSTGPELERLAALHTDVTEVGDVAERAAVGELILSHYLPAEPEAITLPQWADRAGRTFSGRTTAGYDGLRRTVGTRLVLSSAAA